MMDPHHALHLPLQVARTQRCSSVRNESSTMRSRFDPKRNVIVVNNGHRDFVYASRSKSLKLRYLVRLYAKELVLRNFVGLPADQLLERMVELSLRTEEHL